MAVLKNLVMFAATDRRKPIIAADLILNASHTAVARVDIDDGCLFSVCHHT